MTEQSVIIVAGGSGVRMGSQIPKQFLKIAQKPILMHTIEAFYKYNQHIDIVLVLPKSEHKYWENLTKEYNFKINHRVIEGGKERFFSVKNGLQEITKKGLIAVHDGVRPLVSLKTIDACFSACEKHKAVVPVVAINESLRKIESGKSCAVNRNLYFKVQTPQVFNHEVLKKAYEQDFNPLFTDDASVVEHSGCKIVTVEGNKENIKITHPTDLKFAEILLT